VHSQHPKRLINAEYIKSFTSLHLYKQTICGAVSLHWHEFYELGFILAGQGTHILNGQAYQLGRGSIFLLTPADFHQVISQPHEPLQLYDLVFSFDALSEEVFKLLFSEQRQYLSSCSEPTFTMIEAEFQALWSELNSGQPGRELMLRSALERILIYLLRSCLTEEAPLTQTTPDQRHQKLHKSLIYIHHHFRERLTLEEVAQQLPLSANYFSECFSQTYGISFQKYLQELRLQFAFSLLSSATLSITEVCYAAGFNNLSHFERVFKQKFGQLPSRIIL
jgi:AraC-like DNA-binding protein